jgi:hypothetical protein
MSTRVTIFGESIPVTTTGGIRAPTLKRLLRTRTDLICRLTSAFDGMTDGKETRDEIVGPDWVIKRLINETSTLRITPAKFLGVDTIDVYSASYDVDIYDGEVVRRQELIASLPHQSLGRDTPTTLAYNHTGRRVFWRDISNARIARLASTTDGIAFDEEVTRLLALTDIEELAVYLQPSRSLPDFTRRSPLLDLRRHPGGWAR